MSAKIIEPYRYKKTTRKKVEKAKHAKKTNLKYKKTKLKNIKDNKKNVDTIFNQNGYGENLSVYNKKYKNKRKINDKKKNVSKNKYLILKVCGLIFCIGVIGILSRIIVKYENEVIVEADSSIEQKVTLMQNYDFKIGMSKLDTTEYLKSKNIVLSELVKISNNSLLNVNKDYTINYKIAKYIEKINSKEYFIEINPEYKISIEDIINSINMLKDLGEDCIYYNIVNNIENISKQGNTELKINLKNPDNYFIYKLDFPLIANSKGSAYSINTNEDNIVLKNENSKSTLNSIKFKGYLDPDELINKFRSFEIDMFTASSDSIVQLIGKHDYNVKKYRDGQTIFLFGNKESILFKRKEVRQALLYSLNREEIVKEINSSFAEVIDIPYIYSDIKMKYDVYGAQNSLLSQGWQKVDGVYKRQEDDKLLLLELNLLVNESDNTKVKIAEKIKEMAELNGIKVNVNKQKDDALQESISSKNYDLILADVYINNIPDISFIEEYVNINDEINSAFNIVNNSLAEQLPKNLLSLQNLISNEVACIGILARNTSLIYQKNINGFSDIGYMKLFDNIEKIGKIQSIKSDIKEE